MKEAHLTLRLPAELARALARRARDAGVAKSYVVREAVTAYLAGLRTATPTTVTAAELAARWRALPHLTPAEASTLGDDLAAARAELPEPRTAWE